MYKDYYSTYKYFDSSETMLNSSYILTDKSKFSKNRLQNNFQ